jgi:hypothetical protein
MTGIQETQKTSELRQRNASFKNKISKQEEDREPKPRVESDRSLFERLFLSLTSMVLDFMIKLLPSLLVILVVAAAIAAILLFMKGQVENAQELAKGLPFATYRLLAWFPNTAGKAAFYSYCLISHGRGCFPTPPIEKVIGGLIDEVEEAHDVFEVVTRLGSSTAASLGDSALQ